MPAAPIFSIPEPTAAQSKSPLSSIDTNFGEPLDFLASQASIADDSADEWMTVTNNKKRSRGSTGNESRKRGRPKGTTLAAKQNRDIRTFHVPDTQPGSDNPTTSTPLPFSHMTSSTSIPTNI
jgi:hypothetical protein